jgi:hypothetical protein
VREFAGLTSTQKAAEIVGPLGLARTTLSELLRSPDCDGQLGLLLKAMKDSAKPVKPDDLGKLGREHVEYMAGLLGVAGDAKVEYLKQTFEAGSLPYVVEVGFAYFGRDKNETGEPIKRTLVIGLNFSPTIHDPFRNLGVGGQESLGSLLAHHHAGPDDPVFILVHVTTPRFVFIDKGKTAVQLPHAIARGLTEMAIKATAKWSRQRVAEIRHAAAAARRRDSFTRRDKPMSIKDAAYRVMAQAYAHAAGSLGSANARQVMYAARPEILRLTGRARFGDAYFTQTLLPDYQREHPAETANWDVVYDDRGHFVEPHTGRVIGLGTRAVRAYLGQCRDPSVASADVVAASISTFGPNGRYRSALFIEKEGFLPIIERSSVAERFDTALMSTKGMSVTAARQLIDALAAHGVKVFVLHDFDVSGFSIRKTFTESGRRHTFKNDLDYVDIGLRLEDVEKLALDRGVAVADLSEPVPFGGDRDTRAKRLRINGATQPETIFLLGAGGRASASS